MFLPCCSFSTSPFYIICFSVHLDCSSFAYIRQFSSTLHFTATSYHRVLASLILPWSSWWCHIVDTVCFILSVCRWPCRFYLIYDDLNYFQLYMGLLQSQIMTGFVGLNYELRSVTLSYPHPWKDATPQFDIFDYYSIGLVLLYTCCIHLSSVISFSSEYNRSVSTAFLFTKTKPFSFATDEVEFLKLLSRWICSASLPVPLVNLFWFPNRYSASNPIYRQVLLSIHSVS